jgi:hypothetical protein
MGCHMVSLFLNTALLQVVRLYFISLCSVTESVTCEFRVQKVGEHYFFKLCRVESCLPFIL